MRTEHQRIIDTAAELYTQAGKLEGLRNCYYPPVTIEGSLLHWWAILHLAEELVTYCKSQIKTVTTEGGLPATKPTPSEVQRAYSYSSSKVPPTLDIRK